MLPDEPGESDGCQVADSGLIGGSVLDDLSAQVGALDGTKVLLVGLAVAAVLEEHVGVASLDLSLQDGKPEGLRLDDFLGPPLTLIPGRKCGPNISYCSVNCEQTVHVSQNDTRDWT